MTTSFSCSTRFESLTSKTLCSRVAFRWAGPWLAVFLLFFSWGSAGWAHPHAFADCRLAVVFDAKGLEGFRVRMKFDEMHTNLVLMEIQQEIDEDTATPPPSSQSEMYDRVTLMIQEQFRNTGFFTHVLVDSKPFPVQEVRRFTAESQDGKMVCSFFVPCPIPAGAQMREVTLSLYDENYYHDLTLPENAVSMEGGKGWMVEAKMERIESFRFYLGQLVPKGMVIRFRNKDGKS